jgi:hypothetical protein
LISTARRIHHSPTTAFPYINIHSF